MMIMNNKKIVIGILLILLAVYLSGCVKGDDGLSGTYTCNTSDGVLDLCGLDQWELSTPTENTCGQYTFRHGEIRLKSAIGIFIPLELDGRDLIDPDGDRWVRD